MLKLLRLRLQSQLNRAKLSFHRFYSVLALVQSAIIINHTVQVDWLVKDVTIFDSRTIRIKCLRQLLVDIFAAGTESAHQR